MPLGIILGARSRNKARKLTKKANTLERRRRSISNVLARRQALAALRTQQAQTTALAVGSGLEGGSAARNSAGNIQTQVDANVAAQTQLGQIDLDRNRALQAADSRQRQAGRFDAATKLTFQAATAIVTGGTSLAAGGAPDFTNLTK